MSPPGDNSKPHALPRVSITLFMGMSYRNFVLSGLGEALRAVAQLEFLTLEDQTSLRKNLIEHGFSGQKIPRRFLDKVRDKILAIVEMSQYFRFYEVYRPATMEKYIRRMNAAGTRRWRVAKAAAGLVALFRNDRRLLAFPYSLWTRRRLDQCLEGSRAVLLLSTDLAWDKAVALYAKKRGVRIIQCVHSWDNLPARGFLACEPDRLLVWNYEMKQQAISLHGIPPEKIEVTGVPQYDLYLQLGAEIGRAQFLSELGLQPNDRFYTYTCSAERVFPDEDQFIELLYGIARQAGLALIVRLHPTEREAAYRRQFSGRPGLLLDEPTGDFSASTTVKGGESLPALKRFVGLMKHSEIVFNMASTITLDANLFLTPVICIGFNVNPALAGAWNAAPGWYTSSHFGPIVASGAIKVARSASELALLIRETQENPNRDQEARQALREQFSPHAGSTMERFAIALRKEIG